MSEQGMQQPSRFIARQASLAAQLQNAGLDVLAINPGPSLSYLTGLSFHLSERPVIALFSPGLPVQLVLPELELAKVAGLSYPLVAYSYGEDPAGWPHVFQQAAQAARLDTCLVGVEPGRLRFLELRLLEGIAPGARFLSAEDSLAALRMRKDASELDSMRRAVDIAQRALQAVLPLIRAGMSEYELAAELTLQLLKAGSASELPFAPIVSSGPNSANPHASPSERRLSPGDLLVIDWGASYQGYFSDLTRTLAIGEPGAELRHIAETVAEANAAGRNAGRPGLPASVVDAAARQVIDAAGYGPYFTHRTGHGLGLEGHEPPYMRAGNPMILAEGMTYTVEPGIYLPNRNGVRIEDDLVITTDGSECLSNLPRELIVVEPV